MSTIVAHRPYPKIGEPFKLELDGDYKDNQPLEIVRSAYEDSRGWAHSGPLVTGRATRSFKLVEFRVILTFGEVLNELARHGSVPEGQWVNGFKVWGPKPDGKGPVGIADASWWAPDGRLNFPGIGRGGDVRFNRAFGTFGPGWRWIVEI